ncbi:MAG: FecR family protein [Dyadobacter sp.]
MNQPVPSAFLLEKYLNDQCTAQEKEQVEKWYESINGKTDYLDSLSESEQIGLQQETFAYIKMHIQEEKQHNVRAFSPSILWLSGIAATLLLGFGIYYLNLTSQKTDTIASKELSKTEISNTILFENNEPRMVKYKLPDGSSVWMHADASISYPKVFDKSNRMVTFTGEGFFDITPDKTRPFIIQSGEVKIKVLGTRFNVKAKDKEKIFEVSVVSGSVSVSAPGKEKEQEVLLKPQQKAFFETTSKRLTFIQIPVQAKKEIFEPVTIIFEETPLESVIKQLEQRFETHIHLTNPDMYRCKLTADFEQQSLPVILDMLCTSLEGSYTMSENTILIAGIPCK